jgi:hypothetical protein
LSKRPGVLAYYDFQRDDANPTLLRNLAASGEKFDGRLIGGAKWCDGRLPGKKAIKFLGGNSGVRINIPVDCKQLSLVVWLRKLAVVDPDLAAILDSDDFHSRAGAIHWQFVDSLKSFYLDVSKGSSESNVTRRDPDLFNRDTALDHWYMYAETFDSAGLRGTCYVNGKLTGRETFGEAKSARIGSATIGGLTGQSPAARTVVDRTLGGDIDELLVVQAELSQEEIEQLYQSGKPEN